MPPKFKTQDTQEAPTQESYDFWAEGAQNAAQLHDECVAEPTVPYYLTVEMFAPVQNITILGISYERKNAIWDPDARRFTERVGRMVELPKKLVDRTLEKAKHMFVRCLHETTHDAVKGKRTYLAQAQEIVDTTSMPRSKALAMEAKIKARPVEYDENGNLKFSWVPVSSFVSAREMRDDVTVTSEVELNFQLKNSIAEKEQLRLANLKLQEQLARLAPKED